MAYDKTFYRAYEKYLKERTVRDSHDWVLSRLSDALTSVVDLGCGQSQEFKRFGHPFEYRGIDENVEDDGFEFFKGNYRNKEDLQRVILNGSIITGFVSLFSCEITAMFHTNYELYDWIFYNFPKIQEGLVSGFYYSSKSNQNPIGETGGIQSWQTLEDPEEVISKRFTEKRVVLPVPSKMFGKDVFEVWKFFERR